MTACYCCETRTPVDIVRSCPECGYTFQGKGWGGIDAHWKSNHLAVREYGDFWNGLCDPHKKSSAVPKN